ncbi:ECF transporter S component [Clostridium sp. CX1]|uniref:Riboflavin transporter n=1 Tax=Clostridium tanneri TaxID=3037988 RepID=A0ABU4JRD2_9CLOT|nr:MULTISPECIES: ECF transporter S component [unclassified Clostridium]MCT8975832.1 ECF transporter S component [Clostridium sp. CX1]MDW8800685.1 ECF transporter S component [Clostridium sp. A1-XYC3]
MRNGKLNRLVKISLLSVIGFLLMFIEVAVPIFPTFLKIDISDLPALIGAFALGPTAGVAIELLKNILHGIFKGSTAFVGEFANFAVGTALVFVAGYIYNKNKSKKTALIGLLTGSLVMAVVASLLNYFILLPLYEKVLNFPISAVVAMGHKLNSNITNLETFILWSIAPFNLIKGIILSALTMAVYKSVSPIIHEEGSRAREFAKNN